jgi:hypothetical protein
MRLDEDKLEALRHWGQGLRQAGSEKDTAAGRAILMLIDEIERLHIELEGARRQLSRVTAVPPRDEPVEDVEEPFPSTLHRRLQRVLRRESDASSGSRPEPAEEAGSALESDGTQTSPQAWIEAMRRQE